MKTPIIFVNGLSGTGKSTAARYIEKNFRVQGRAFVHLHPTSDLKQYLQSVYDCPSLLTREGKVFRAPDSPSDMQTILVRLWEVFVRDGLDPAFSQRLMAKALRPLPQDTPLVIEGLRCPGEVRFVAQMAKERNLTSHFIHLTTGVNSGESSDVHEPYIEAQLCRLAGLKEASIYNALDSKEVFYSRIHAHLVNWGIDPILHENAWGL